MVASFREVTQQMLTDKEAEELDVVLGELGEADTSAILNGNQNFLRSAVLRRFFNSSKTK